MTDAPPRHPGKILFDQVMTPLGVSRNKLARDIDVPVGRISDIVAGKRGVTPDTALRFAKYFGTTAELWLHLQADYDLYVARTTTWADAEPKVAVFQPLEGGGETAAPAPAAPAAAPAPAPVPDSPPAVPVHDVLSEPETLGDHLPDMGEIGDDEEGDIDIPQPQTGKA